MKRFILVLTIAIFTTLLSQAQWVQFSNSDLELSTSEAIIKHGTDWYAATPGGVFKSTDNGQNWVLTTNNLFSALGRLRIEGFAQSGTTLIGVNRWSGIVTTTDGSTWTASDLSTFPTNFFLSQKLVVLGSRVMAVVKDTDTDTFYLYYSDNASATWTQGATITGANKDLMLFSDGTTAYISHTNASENDEFLGETTDGISISASSFTPAYPGTSIENLEKSGDFLIVNGENTIYRYDINTPGWSDLSTVWTNGITYVTVEANETGRLYASVLEGNNNIGFHTSTDQGDSWIALSPTMAVGQPFFMGLHATGDEFMVSFIDEGMHYSADAGTTIARRNTGLVATDFEELVVAGSNLVAPLSISGAYVSTDNGNTWSKENAGLPTDPIQQLKDFTMVGSVLYANHYATPDENPSPNAVYYSEDNGLSWTNSNDLPPFFNINTLQLIGVNDNTSYLFSDNNSIRYFTRTHKGSIINISTNIPNEFTPRYVTGDGTTAYIAGTDASNKLSIYTSLDNGGTWTLAMDGITITDLAPIDSDDKFLLINAGTSKAFAKIKMNSENTIMRWQTNKWYSLNAFNLPSHEATCMVYNNSELYISILNEGIFRSTDDGNTFTKLGDLPVGLYAESMTFINNELIISTARGLWQYDLSTNLTKPVSNNPVLYPNPAKDFVNIDTEASLVQFYSATGELVKEVKPETNTISVTDLNAGIYIVVIQSNSATTTSKFQKR